MTKKRLIIIAIVLIGLFFFYKLGDMFAPGSYPYAEHYELNYPEDKVIEAINNLKASDSGLLVPKVTIQGAGQWDLNDGKENKKDFWYKFYFYDKKKNEIMFTWTRPAGQSKTTFAFVSINKGLDLGHWEVINDDFGFFENRKIKKDFEETILKKIKENLDNN
ncbi:hypothetical protein [Algoriphagus mannitolivorans]|uniref:hypothetical protein n=1 Tax=Algoriphagus mannitolivorans TaxID=226504 RepID=UPI00047BD616|nr:hypothetical protein [Algoriphagus mannitolivorans]